MKTTCEICGGPLTHPDEFKVGYHLSCYEDWKMKNHFFRGSGNTKK